MDVRDVRKETWTKTCPGMQRAVSASEPNWFDQADKQMSDLCATLIEINDESIMEAWDALESQIDSVRRIKGCPK